MRILLILLFVTSLSSHAIVIAPKQDSDGKFYRYWLQEVTTFPHTRDERSHVPTIELVAFRVLCDSIERCEAYVPNPDPIGVTYPRDLYPLDVSSQFQSEIYFRVSFPNPNVDMFNRHAAIEFSRCSLERALGVYFPRAELYRLHDRDEYAKFSVIPRIVKEDMEVNDPEVWRTRQTEIMWELWDGPAVAFVNGDRLQRAFKTALDQGDFTKMKLPQAPTEDSLPERKSYRTTYLRSPVEARPLLQLIASSEISNITEEHDTRVLNRIFDDLILDSYAFAIALKDAEDKASIEYPGTTPKWTYFGFGTVRNKIFAEIFSKIRPTLKLPDRSDYSELEKFEIKIPPPRFKK